MVIAVAALDATAWGGRDGDQVDSLGLAAVLIRDGHLDRAAGVLADVDTTDEALDRAQYHALLTIVWLKRGGYERAVHHAKAAVSAGKEGGEIRLLLGQAHFGLGQHAEALAAFDAAGEAGRTQPGIFLLRAQCLWRLGRKDRAWAVLGRGLARFPGHAELRRQRVLLLVDLGLYQQAISVGARYLARAGAGAGDHVAIAEMFRRSGEHRRSVALLERARLRFPDDERVARALARAHLDAGNAYAAAGLLFCASLSNPALAVEAAEVYRRAGKLLRALHLNARVRDQKAKVRQRLGLLIDLERFEEAATLEPRLRRLGLLADEKLAYALAYALFRAGRLDRCEAHLRGITDPKLFQSALRLREAIAAAKERRGP